MRDNHAPRNEFIEQLHLQIAAEVRRRNRTIDSAPRWMPRSRMAIAAGVVVLVVVSMAAGGAVVNAAHQAQTNERRNLLAANYSQRVALAMQRLELAKRELIDQETRVSIGVVTQRTVLESRFKVAEADAQLRVLQLQLQEVTVSGQEAIDTISAPLVGGIDFVSQRLRAAMAVPESAIALAHAQIDLTNRQVSVGAVDSLEVDVARARFQEVEAGVMTFRRKLDIRERFLKKEMDAGEADLRVLEAEAEQRRIAVTPKIDLARKRLDRAEAQVKVGLAQNLSVAQARLELLQLQVELSIADVDLAGIRKRIADRKNGR